MAVERTSLTAPGAEVLRGLCGGAVHLPGDAAFDEVRVPWNLQVDASPAAVAYPAFPSEVAEVIRAAASVGLKVAPQGTGHGAPPLAGRLDDAVLLRTSAMTELQIDAERRTARVGAGLRWGDVVERAGRSRLAARHTTSPGVGVVGSSLGGGLSWYARSSGLQCSALTAVEVVLADGTFVRATDTHDSDVLWAARGGGGGFGVVTALEFDLLPVRRVYAGMLAWDWKHADRVLRTWAEFAGDAPEAVTSIARLLQAPDEPWLPADVRGRRLVVIDSVVLGDSAEAERILAPLRALRPEIDTCADVAAAAAARLHLDPEAPTAVYANSIMLADLPDRAVEALVASAGPGSQSDLLFVELRQLGGALSRPSARAGALDRMDGSVLVLAVGTETGSGWEAVRAQVGRVTSMLEPWSTGSVYLLMADDEAEARRGWPAASWQRLAALRAQVDPRGMFVTPHA
ncbi:FAD-binding oxidoreductase [Agromyces humatus]|uniref:FAD-binding oxidoreductase n=1 Tax=Agromyces humatus TaxID=279573 RepID=A0ABP4WWR0_9MICO|nr:FAD-binding protein [Agromyces humatus]